MPHAMTATSREDTLAALVRNPKSLEDYYAEQHDKPYKLTTDHRRAGEVVARAFQPNAYNKFVTHGVSLEHNTKDFQDRCKDLLENKSIICQADDFAAVAVWIPPEFDYYPYQEPLDADFRNAEAAFAQCAVKYFKGGPFWHLTMLAKDPLREDVKGATSKVMRPILDDEVARGLPAALECIDERAKKIYEYYGFKTYEVVRVGEGKCNPEGDEKPGGEGILVYYMIFNYNDPQLKPLL